jgi:hypothetical protein
MGERVPGSVRRGSDAVDRAGQPGTDEGSHHGDRHQSADQWRVLRRSSGDRGEQFPQRCDSERHVGSGWAARSPEHLIRFLVSCVRNQRERDQRHRPGLIPRDPEQPLDSAVANLIHQQERCSHVGDEQPGAGDVPKRDGVQQDASDRGALAGASCPACSSRRPAPGWSCSIGRVVGRTRRRALVGSAHQPRAHGSPAAEGRGRTAATRHPA